MRQQKRRKKLHGSPKLRKPLKLKRVDDAVKDAVAALELIVQGDMDKAMNQFNKKAESSEGNQT